MSVKVVAQDQFGEGVEVCTGHEYEVAFADSGDILVTVTAAKLPASSVIQAARIAHLEKELASQRQQNEGSLLVVRYLLTMLGGYITVTKDELWSTRKNELVTKDDPNTLTLTMEVK